MGVIAGLDCSLCNKHYAPGQLLNLCECGGPLLVHYDLEAIGVSSARELVNGAISSMWRYEKVLAVKCVGRSHAGRGMDSSDQAPPARQESWGLTTSG